MQFRIAIKAMQNVRGSDVEVLRAVAAAYISAVNDECLGVIAEGLGYPPIIHRETFLRHIGALGRKRLLQVMTGTLMLDEFAGTEKKRLMRHYGLSAAKIRKERR